MTVREQTWDLLAEALKEIVYTRNPVPAHRFWLDRDDESNYAMLYIWTYTPNTYRTEEMILLRHEFVVPVQTYHKASWTRWVFDCLMQIELHETCESFLVNGERIYAPHHGKGENTYAFWPGGTPEQKAKRSGEA